MLIKIHDLLQMDKPAKRKTIQVCFKHPDLLKQAREACVARREDTVRPALPSAPHALDRPDPHQIRQRLPRETDLYSQAEVNVVSPGANTNILCAQTSYTPAPPPPPPPLPPSSSSGHLERKGLIPLPPLEVLNPNEPVTPPKVMCIQFDDNDIVEDSPAFPDESPVGDGSSRNESTLNRPSESSSEMFQAHRRREPILEPVTEAFPPDNVPIMHEEEPPTLADQPLTEPTDDNPNMDDKDKTPAHPEPASELQDEGKNHEDDNEESIMDDESLLESDEDGGLTETEDEDEDEEDHDSTSDEYESSADETEDDLFQNIDKNKFKDPTKSFKICYQGYDQRVLTREMKDLVHRPHLHDLELICRDGAMTSSSLLIGSMSRFMYNVLQNAPWYDHLKMVIMPDVKRKDLSVLISLLFNPEKLANLPLRKVKRVERVAKQLQIDWTTLSAKENLPPQLSPSSSKQLQSRDALTKFESGTFNSNESKAKPKSRPGMKTPLKKQLPKSKAPSVPNPGKKKRGRPRKIPIPEEVVKIDLNPLSNAQPETNPSAILQSDNDPPFSPIKPGRKRKEPLDALDPNTNDKQSVKESQMVKKRKTSKNMVQDPNPTEVTSQVPPADIMESAPNEEPEPPQTNLQDKDELKSQKPGPKSKRTAKKKPFQSQDATSPKSSDIKSNEERQGKDPDLLGDPSRSSSTSTPTPSLGRASTPNRRKNETPKKIERWDVKELQDFLANPIDEEISNVELIQPPKSEPVEKKSPLRPSKNGNASESEMEGSKAEFETRASSRRRTKLRDSNPANPEEDEEEHHQQPQPRQVRARASSRGRSRGRGRSVSRPSRAVSEVLSSTFEDTDASHPSNLSVSSNAKTGDDEDDDENDVDMEDGSSKRNLRNNRGLPA